MLAWLPHSVSITPRACGYAPLPYWLRLRAISLLLGRGIGQIEQAALQSHQPLAFIKGPWRLRRTQQMGSLLKELLQRLDALLGARIAQG